MLGLGHRVRIMEMDIVFPLGALLIYVGLLGVWGLGRTVVLRMMGFHLAY